MLAPRRNAPCWMASVAFEKTSMKESGPSVVPPEERTRSPRGRSREKEKPVPPPAFWISAVALMESKMPSIESSTGRTKHAESIPISRPAFIKRRAVRHEAARRHHPVEVARHGERALARSAGEFELGLRHVARHAPEELAGRLDHRAGLGRPS